ncbi:alcohol dehydrogenase catalytic domain-containing protein [Polaromonas jejuensis]|uniref:alcohol dehydrogenase n=1 Tax=Polaromonas jejuensis TaxID=457502 RepID=A0ABW0Q5J9_9BURK|nr:alcohol dehydrogenase catalytic domain-containing protein [Polaromonas jejuensis]
MKAIVMDEFGEPDVLKMQEIPRPLPGADEVLVRIKCCGVCHLDLILRSGMRSRVKPPRILGHELAAEVLEVGANVDDFVPGDRITSFNFQACGKCADCLRGRPSLCRQTLGDIGQTRDGGYAEYAVLLASNLVKLPDGMLFEHACFAACVYGPPYKAIRGVGKIQPGQTVVITGASGGLGLAAIQITKSLGARSIAITSNASKVDRLKALGADEVVVSPDGAFGEDVRQLTKGRGADLVVELIGSPTFHGSLRSLAPGGRIAVVGELHGTPVEINLGLLIIKEFELHGVQSANRAELQEILQFMHDNAIEPTIWKSLPLDKAAEAHRELANREVIGRVLLVP